MSPFEMKVLLSLCVALITPICSAVEQISQFNGRTPPELRPVNIAVIGAGAAGSSAAYHLARYAAEENVALNLTVFERSPYIGGRSTTVNAYDDPTHPVELGASIFVEVNQILVDAANDFNLSTASMRQVSTVPGPALGVWDGRQFRLTQSTGLAGWFDLAKLLWRYGTAPIRTNNLMRATVGKFLRMYESPHFPFRSLTQVAEDLELLKVTAATGEQFMEENAIAGDFGRDVVQASTRVNYAQNLRYIHGLEAMVCMATDGARSVDGGNWQIFASMLKASGAKVATGTEVVDIENRKGSYALRSRAISADGMRLDRQQFDSVVIATPLQYSDLDLVNITHSIDSVPYVELHVTLFTSPHLLSSAFFSLLPGKAVPHAVLTTLGPDEAARSGKDGVGSPGFFSISLLRSLSNPTTNSTEYLYKIFSPSATNATFLSQILGTTAPRDDTMRGTDISWIYRKVWNSYPYEYPRVTFEEIRIEDNLYYTGGMESFISTMETNALMGKNVARLIADGWHRHDSHETVENAAARVDL